jgi:hypothetical protein
MVSALGGQTARVLKKTRSSGPKDKTANMSYVSHSARLDGCHRPNVEELGEKPETD